MGIVPSALTDNILILTALHVVQHARSVDVTFYSSRQTRYHASVVSRRSDSLDLALLEVLPQNNPKLPTTFRLISFCRTGSSN
jgi:hypothetical protein